MKHRVTWIAALALLPLLNASCSDRKAQAAAPDYTYEQREDYRRDMDVAVNKLDARIAELRNKAASGTEQAKQAAQTLIDEAQKGIADLRRELSEIGTNTSEGWNDFKRKFKTSIDDLNRRVDAALH